MFLNRIGFHPDTRTGSVWVSARQPIEKHLLFQAVWGVFFKVDHRYFGPEPMSGTRDFQFGFQFITNRLMHRFIWNFQALFVC